MDLVVVVLFTFIYGFIKLYRSGNISLDSSPVMNDDGSITVSESFRPVGNNLMLKKEPDAYTLILKELGLKK